MTDDDTIQPSLTREQQEELFGEILYVYDLVDDVAAVLEREDVKNRTALVALTTPLITQIINSNNIIATFYSEVVHKKRPITPDLQDTFERAFRNVFITLKEFLDELDEKMVPQGGMS